MDPAMEYEVRALSRQKAMVLATARGDSQVQAFYHGATLLVTGFSGFLGKQLVEKLLRSCPDIKKIYLLLREKKGVDIQTRLGQVLTDPVFEPLRQTQPAFQKKLVPIAGDTSEIGLALSEGDKNTIIEEVDVIFHVAATTRFDDTLRVSVNTNVRGARELLLLAKACLHLKSVVYMSTAYSGATYDLKNADILEKFYGSPVDPQALIDVVNSMDQDVVNDGATKLIRGWPNNYTFSKRVAEELVRSLSDGLPLCVVRPTIVISTYNEPSPGWLEPTCAYGASGVILGVGVGVVHVLLADHKSIIDLVPADMVNNLAIVAGWETARRFRDGVTERRIYTIGTSARNPLKFASFKSMCNKEVPSTVRATPSALYFSFSVETPYRLLAYMLSWLLHWIPGYFVDGVLFILGKKPILNKVYTKVWKISSLLSPFMTNQWTFRDDNTVGLYQSLSQTDKDIYNFDVTSFDWKEMMCMWILGLRKYIIKDGLRNTEYGIKKQLWLRYINYLVSALYAYLWWKVLCFGFWIISIFFKF